MKARRGPVCRLIVRKPSCRSMGVNSTKTTNTTLQFTFVSTSRAPRRGASCPVRRAQGKSARCQNQMPKDRYEQIVGDRLVERYILQNVASQRLRCPSGVNDFFINFYHYSEMWAEVIGSLNCPRSGISSTSNCDFGLDHPRFIVPFSDYQLSFSNNIHPKFDGVFMGRWAQMYVAHLEFDCLSPDFPDRSRFHTPWTLILV